MTIPAEINFIVDKLNRELDEIEQVGAVREQPLQGGAVLFWSDYIIENIALLNELTAEII